MGQKQKERNRQRDRERETERQTERDTERERERDRERERQRDRQRESEVSCCRCVQGAECWRTWTSLTLTDAGLLVEVVSCWTLTLEAAKRVDTVPPLAQPRQLLALIYV